MSSGSQTAIAARAIRFPDAFNHFWLLPCATVGRKVRVTGPVLIRGTGSIVIGDEVLLDAGAAPIELHAVAGARICIADGVRLGPGASIEARDEITIEKDAKIGAFAKVLDSHWHRTTGDRREMTPARPVTIGSGAHVGARSTVLPGARMGPGSVLLPDSMLTRGVPPGVVVGGVPARLVAGPPTDISTSTEAARPYALLATDGFSKVGTSTLLRRQLRTMATRGGILPWVERWVEPALESWHIRGTSAKGRNGINGKVSVENHGEVVIGPGVDFIGGALPTRIRCKEGARVVIGEGCQFNYGAWLEAAVSIRIGRRCLVASRVLILDSTPEKTAPIIIGDDVWLANGVTVLPGVTIGSGSAVAAGSVVASDVPPGSLAVGTPARCIPLPPT